MIYPIINKYTIRGISITSCLLITLFYILIFGLYIDPPVSGYCTFDNCKCITLSALSSGNVCEKYTANVFYRIFDRSYWRKYDNYFKNVTVLMCPKESICYARKFSTENKIYLLRIESTGFTVLYMLLYIACIIYSITFIIYVTIQDDIMIKNNISAEQNDENDVRVELDKNEV